MKIRTTYDKCPYITAGKVYEGSSVMKRSTFTLLDIEDDEGDVLSVVVGRPCHRLDNTGRWEIVCE